MKLQSILPILEELAPLAYAEDFDNVGLLLGNSEQEISGILVCHDALENVVDEAIEKNCNLIVCFHPIVFSGLKKITGKTYVERIVLKAIKNDIAIYAVHTALDNHQNGVNKIICNQLGLVNTKILVPKEKFIRKLVTYTIPENHQKLRNALFGEGKIGDDMNFNWVNASNIHRVYQQFIHTAEDRKDSYSREDWDEVKLMYEALDSRKNTVEKEGLTAEDNRKIAGLKFKFAPMLKLNRMGAKSEEMKEAKQ